MSRLKRYVGGGQMFEIDGEEVGEIKPLGTKYIPKFFKLMKAFGNVKEDADMSELIANFDDEVSKTVTELIDATLDKSFPDSTPAEKEVFGMKHMMTLLPMILEVNIQQSMDPSEKKKADMIQKIKDTRKPNVAPEQDKE